MPVSRRRSAARLRRPRPRPELRRAARGDDPALPAARPSASSRSAASAVTVVAARLSWRGWSDELRRFLRSGTPRPEFQPLLRDVRELVDRIVAEKEADREGGAWTPQRLKQTLNRYLHGEKVVIVANREPYIHERTEDGGVVVVHPASGLVTALEPVMRACSGVWIAHGSGSADRETADTARPRPRAARRGVLPAPPRLALARGGEGLLLRLLQRGALAALPHRPRPARSSAARTGSTTRPSTRSSPTPSARRSTPTTRSSSCRTTTSRWRPG